VLLHQLFTGLLKGTVPVSLDVGTDGELANSGCLVATEYKREQGYLLLLTSENRQCHKQAPEGARD